MSFTWSIPLLPIGVANFKEALKRQPAGSEFVAARLATKQIMDLRCTLRSFGAPLDGKACMLCDNESVITSSTVPHSSLNKRHNALSYH
jgi:hypothetical protein